MRTFTLSLLILLGLALPAAAQGTRYVGPSADTTARDAASAAQADATTALQLAQTYSYYVSLTAAAEAANTRAVTVAVQDRALNPVDGSVTILCELRDANMAVEASTTFRMAETGAGSENSTTAKSTLLLTSDATGNATLTVTDVAGASGLTTTLFCRPVGHGAMSRVALTFDGV